MKKIIFQKETIDASKIIEDTGSESDGSILCFIGRARNRSRERDVLYLEYEIYESMAAREMDKIVTKAMSGWTLSHCTVIHRFGPVKIGEASILISVSSPHRNESYMASRYIIDKIKEKVPIWKKEFYSDGSVWISERS